MSERIKILNSNLKALGSTSKAFNVEKSKELMREYTLSFSVSNDDSVFKYLGENIVFQFSGQYFNIAGLDGDSGTKNITQMTAEHISYQLSDYTLPNGYSFVGSVKQIAEDILKEAKTVDEIAANTVFSVGETADLGTLSFSMSGATNVTAREALIAMSELGVEVDFDNFTVHLPERIGADNGLTFRYGVNLEGVHRTWQKGNGWSYEIKIADLQKVPGYEGYEFKLGDNVTVIDEFSNIIINSRIITYIECDDPSQNRVVIGVFVRDNASLAIETDRIANSANLTANNSVQQGQKYSNVSISHKNGFMATNRAGTQRVMMNGEDCFIVQILQNGEWITVNSLESFGIVVDRITNQECKEEFYIQVGKIEWGGFGLKFFHNSESCFEIGLSNNGSLHLVSYKDINIESKRKTGLNDSCVEITATNISLRTTNIVKQLSDGSGRSCPDGELVIVDKSGVTRSISISSGLITKIG